MAGIMKRLTFADGVVVADPPDLSDFVGNSVVYEVVFSAESQKDLVVSAQGFDARSCIVQIRNPSDSFKAENFEYYAVDVNTLRIVAASSITKTIHVVVSA